MPSDFEIPKIIKIMGNLHRTTLKLKGIVFYGHHYFTMQRYDNDGSVWFHDGQENAGCVVKITSMDNITSGCNSYKGKKATLAIYGH